MLRLEQDIYLLEIVILKMFKTKKKSIFISFKLLPDANHYIASHGSSGPEENATRNTTELKLEAETQNKQQSKENYFCL